ncbi:MAG: tRNA (guanosine(46)-N7)-methyltransferase TrmB [Verrucomicrobiales bacterium]
MNTAVAPSISTADKTLFIRPASFFEVLKLHELFPLLQPIELEIGSGDGSFMAVYAEQNRRINFIAIERLLGRARKLEKKAFRKDLNNLRILRIEAAYALEYLLPNHSIAAFHLYFPDPWPKRRHLKNRLVNEAFTDLVWKKLVSQGCIFLRTDNEDYFAQMERVFSANPKFTKVESPGTLLDIKTDFERGFNAKGIPTLHVCWKKLE